MNEDFLFSEALIRCLSPPEQVFYYLKEGEFSMKHLLMAAQRYFVLVINYHYLKKKERKQGFLSLRPQFHCKCSKSWMTDYYSTAGKEQNTTLT